MRKFITLILWLLMAFTLTSFNADGFFSFSKIKDRLTQSNPIKIITRTCATIQRNYYDQKRINPAQMMEDGLQALARTIPEMLVIFPKTESNKFIISFNKESRVIEFIPPVNIFDILDPLAKAFQFINTKYEGELSASEREYEFIRGMLHSLDPHSNLLTPTIFKEFKTATKGEYGGIGIVIGMKEEDLSVIAPIEDTPAMRAGLEADDKIREIDHVPTINMQLDEAVDLLRGIVNTKVNLLIERKKQQPFTVTLTREKIVIRSVKAKLEQRNNQSVAIISIRSFQEETFAEMVKALTNFSKLAPIDNIILDFRNNPGGLLDQAIEISDKFLAAGTILYSVGAENSQEEVYNATFGQDLINAKIIALVNEGSASASEIVAGALKNNNRVAILGIKTFGKGSVQSVFNLQGGAAIKLTIAQYLTPGRISIQAVGITPDVEVYPRLTSKEFLDLKKDESYGEENLDSHLVNAEHIKQEKPAFELNFLQAEKKTEESAYVSEIDPAKDYTLNLAMDLITRIKSNNRPAMLTELLPLLVEEQKNQEKKIAQALQEQGVAWGLADATSLTNAKTSLKISIKNEQNRVLETIHAGDKIKLELTAKNEGTTSLERVIGVIKSENPLFDEKEFLFGHLDAGQEKMTEVALTVPENSINIEEELRVVLFSQLTEITSLGLDTKIIAKPKMPFAYQYKLIDNGLDGTKGNNNGVPEPGETIALKISIGNLSDRPTKEINVNIKNLEGDGVYLREARSKVDIIPAGKSKDVVMLFDVNAEFPEPDMELDLTISEKDSRSGITDRFHFPTVLAQKDHFDPLPTYQQITPKINVQTQKLIGRDTLEIAGQVTDDTMIKDLMIYIGPKKVFYQLGPKTGDQQAMAFSAQIPLDKGANVISIQARDNRKLTGYETISVVLPKDQVLAAQ